MPMRMRDSEIHTHMGVASIILSYIYVRLARGSIHVLNSIQLKKETKMLQSTYDMWILIPQMLGGLIVMLCHAYIIPYPCFKCWKTSRQELREKLATLSLKILFRQERLPEEMKEVKQEEKEHAYGVKTLARKYFTAIFSTLPLMLLWMAFVVFWDKFLIYETDQDCGTEDLILECFSNSSGPLSCSAVRELRMLFNSSYNCYKFSFDLVNAVASAGGIFTLTLLVNGLLVKCFVCVRYRTSVVMAALFQYFVTTISIFFPLIAVLSLTSDFENIMQVLAIHFCSICCCMYPWYLIEPCEDYKCKWIPCYKNNHNYDEIPGQNEPMTGHA